MTAQSPIIGAIRLEPLALAGEYSPSDTTLALVLESFAHRDSLAGGSDARLVASTRLSRLSPSGDLTMGVRANLAQLLDDLQAEYDELAERLPA